MTWRVGMTPPTGGNEDKGGGTVTGVCVVLPGSCESAGSARRAVLTDRPVAGAYGSHR
jgi:hypothetical protein